MKKEENDDIVFVNSQNFNLVCFIYYFFNSLI